MILARHFCQQTAQQFRCYNTDPSIHDTVLSTCCDRTLSTNVLRLIVLYQGRFSEGLINTAIACDLRQIRRTICIDEKTC